MLDLETDNHVIRGARLRFFDGEVFAYELVCVPVDLLPKANGTSALFDIHQLAAALELGQATEGSCKSQPTASSQSTSTLRSLV